jgi:hypothetical protein
MARVVRARAVIVGAAARRGPRRPGRRAYAAETTPGVISLIPNGKS